MHLFPVDPTPDTLSFYAVYLAHYIKLDFVSSYLSGICDQLEPVFPEVQASRHHWLVKKTLAGCQKMFPSITSRKWPITRSELANISQLHSSSSSFNDSLFLAILLTGFHGLMHLGELTWPDVKCLQDYRKIISHNSLQIFLKNLFNLFYQVIKLTTSSKATWSSSSQPSRALTLMLLFWAISSSAIVISPSVLNCGLEKMVLSQLRDGSFISFIVIFPEMLEGSPFMQVALPLLRGISFLRCTVMCTHVQDMLAWHAMVHAMHLSRI